MKKKIINGILLVAMLFATTSAFVSCKDTDADYKSETDAKIAQLEKKLADLQTLVNGIQGCNCADKIAALQAAIDAIKVPTDYLKASDLPELLSDYVTKKNLEDAIAGINGGLTEEQINALIAKALEGYKPETGGLTEEQVNDLIAKALENYKPEVTGGMTEEQVNDLIAKALENYKPEVSGGLTKDEVNALIEDALKNFKPKATDIFTEQELADLIQTIIKEISESINNRPTSISADQVVNPLFSLTTPFGVNTNVLLAYFGEKAKRDIYFPRGSEEPIVFKGEYIVGEIGNAGKIYVTINPSSVDFTGKTLKLVTTGGNESPVELTPLKASNEDIVFTSGETRGENAFYETYATIPAEKLGKAYVSWEPENMEDFKEQIKGLFKGHENNKEEIVEMIRTLYNLILNNNIPAYRLQAAWGDGLGFTYSQANIAAVAMKPLTFAFDLSDEAEYDGEAITALEALESKSVTVATKTESTQAKIWRFLDRFNIYADKAFDNINWVIQPTLLISAGDEVSHPNVYSNTTVMTRYPAGEIKFLPTSWSAEIVAPAFKKYVAVVELNGVSIKADDPVNKGLMGKVVPGSVKEIPFTIEEGKTYKIQYSAIDYEGNIKTLYYVIRGSK